MARKSRRLSEALESGKQRFSVGTRLARYKNQLLYAQRERRFEGDE